MKQLLLTISILICSVLLLTGQSRKKKTEITGIVKEVYYVDKESKLMDGRYYAIHTNTKDTLVTGNFNQGLRADHWVFRNNKTNEKKLEFDFNANTILFIEPNFYPDSFLIQQGNEFVYDKVDRPLILVGYDDELIIKIANQIKIPKELYLNPCIAAFIAFIVDENGTLTGSKIINSCQSAIDQFISQSVNSFNGRLLPAIKDGQPVKSMFFVKINFQGSKDWETSAQNSLPYIFELNFHLAVDSKTMVTVKKIPIGYEYQDVQINNIR